jgi:hypothetical protein
MLLVIELLLDFVQHHAKSTLDPQHDVVALP